MSVLPSSARATAPAEAESLLAARPRQVLLALVGVSVFLVMASIVVPRLGLGSIANPGEGVIGRLVYVDMESSISTWWSSALLGTGAALHLVGALLAKRAHSSDAWPRVLLALFMGAMSVDETTQMHEELSHHISEDMAFGLAFSWVVVGAPVALIMVAVAALAAVKLPPHTRTSVLVGFTLFFAGAIGAEVVGGRIVAEGAEGVMVSTAYMVAVHVEELLELLGATVLFVAGLQGTARGSGIALSATLAA